jgi:predicted SprT family Zn-dependent metalloprotease
LRKLKKNTKTNKEIKMKKKIKQEIKDELIEIHFAVHRLEKGITPRKEELDTILVSLNEISYLTGVEL